MHRICAEGLFALLLHRSLGCCRNTLPPEWRHSRGEGSRDRSIGAGGRSARPRGRSFPRLHFLTGPRGRAPSRCSGHCGLPGDPGGELPGLLPLDYLDHELGSCWGWILGHRAAPGSSGSSFLVCKPGFSRGGGQLGSAASADGEGSDARGIINSLTQSFNRCLFGTHQQDL